MPKENQLTPIEALANCLAPLAHATVLLEARWEKVQWNVIEDQRKDMGAAINGAISGAKDVAAHLNDYLAKCRERQAVVPVAQFMRQAVDCAQTDAHLMCEWIFGEFPMRFNGIFTIERLALSGEMTSLYSWLSFVRVHLLRVAEE